MQLGIWSRESLCLPALLQLLPNIHRQAPPRPERFHHQVSTFFVNQQ